jgi:hypothetical protein
MQWIYLSLAVLAVWGIWDCKITLGNIQRVLFDNQAQDNQRRLNQAAWGSDFAPDLSHLKTPGENK